MNSDIKLYLTLVLKADDRQVNWKNCMRKVLQVLMQPGNLAISLHSQLGEAFLLPSNEFSLNPFYSYSLLPYLHIEQF